MDLMRYLVGLIATVCWFAAYASDTNTFDLDSVQSDFVADISSRDPTFYGAGMGIPGVQIMRYTYCYSHAAGVRQILTDFDGHLHQDDPEVADQKVEYAKLYNNLVMRELNRIGENRCKHGENWDAARFAVREYLASKNPDGFNFSLPANLEDSFGIYISETSGVADLVGSVCAIFRSHGIHRPLKFSITKETEDEYGYRYEKLTEFDCE